MKNVNVPMIARVIGQANVSSLCNETVVSSFGTVG